MVTFFLIHPLAPHCDGVKNVPRARAIRRKTGEGSCIKALFILVHMADGVDLFRFSERYILLLSKSLQIVAQDLKYSAPFFCWNSVNISSFFLIELIESRFHLVSRVLSFSNKTCCVLHQFIKRIWIDNELLDDYECCAILFEIGFQ